jgi:hypothetical protein
MSVEAVEAPAATARLRPPDYAVRIIASALAGSCLVLLTTFLLVGERPGSYADLRAAVADGQVDDVRVEGGLDDGAVGAASVSVHWRDGLIRRATTVTEASSRRQARLLGSGRPVVVGKVDDRLVALDPSLRTSRTDTETRSDVGSWRVPGWASVLTTVTVLVSVGLLIAGPKPRLATRWAWFWLFWVPLPLGVLAFLLLGGSIVSGRRVHHGRRLTGGWAFLLAALLKVTLAYVAAAIA